MSHLASGVNPTILRWARERAAYSAADVARHLRKDIAIIESWESGGSVPTYVQLEKLAYQLYKRPIALFFFPEPPDEPDPKESFRTLPDFEIDNLQSDTRHAVRQAEAMQLALGELNDEVNPAERKIFREIKPNSEAHVDELARDVRKYLGVELRQQIGWGSSDEALKSWRQIVEDVGIFVFKRSFKQRDISGFSLEHDEFPIIYLNNTTAVNRQIFTLFHELAHLLLHTGGITKQDDTYIASLTGEDKRVEVLCNAFAGEFLVPSGDFEGHLGRQPLDEEAVSALATRYKVSREVILRKLLDRGLIGEGYYEEKAEEWTRAYEVGRKRGKGGNYYATQATYLGDTFLKLAFTRYYQERCSLDQLADYLNVRVKNVAGLEQFVSTGAASA